MGKKQMAPARTQGQTLQGTPVGVNKIPFCGTAKA